MKLYHWQCISQFQALPKLLLRGQGIRSNDQLVDSIDQESSQQLKMWFSEHFFAPKLAGLFVTPIVSATSNKFGAKKCLKNHIPFDF